MSARAFVLARLGLSGPLWAPERASEEAKTLGMIQIDSIRSDLPASPRLDSNGELSFRLGGIVRVSGDADGQFRGDVRIDVEYF